MIKQFRLILKTMRLRQWPKNVFVFAALVFDRQLIALDPLLITTAALFLFCLASSLVYIINDLADVEMDRQHPLKRNRPLASGQLSIQLALSAAVFLFLLIFPAAFILDFGSFG